MKHVVFDIYLRKSNHRLLLCTKSISPSVFYQLSKPKTRPVFLSPTGIYHYNTIDNQWWRWCHKLKE